MNDECYAILGVSPTATPAEIKERYKFLCLAFHPDKFASARQQTAGEELKRIMAAYQTLSDPSQGARYDSSTQQASPQPPYEPHRKNDCIPPKQVTPMAKSAVVVGFVVCSTLMVCSYAYQGAKAVTVSSQQVLSPILRTIEGIEWELTETGRKIARATAEATTVSSTLESARRSEPVVKTRIDQLQPKIAQLNTDLSTAEQATAVTERELAGFLNDTLPARREAASEAVRMAAATRNNQTLRDFKQIEADRKARNEERAIIGAQREDQEEALRERQRKRSATKLAENDNEDVRSRVFGQIETDTNRMQERVSLAHSLVSMINAKIADTKTQLESSKLELARLHAEMDVAPQQLRRLEVERSSLIASQRSLEEAARDARMRM